MVSGFGGKADVARWGWEGRVLTHFGRGGTWGLNQGQGVLLFWRVPRSALEARVDIMPAGKCSAVTGGNLVKQSQSPPDAVVPEWRRIAECPIKK